MTQPLSNHWKLTIVATLFAVICVENLSAQQPDPAIVVKLTDESSANRNGTTIAATDSQSQEGQTDSQSNDATPKNNYYVEPRSTGTRRETDPPRYVRQAGDIDLPFFKKKEWLDLGLDFRTRYEYRQNDLRRSEPVLDQPFLLRTRAYFGIHDLMDPLRGYIELEDARRYNSQFPIDNRDVNELDFIQAVAELHFAEGLGIDRPLRFQFGRMAYEYVDRRLIARNEWRNTTNNFEGFRAILGQEKNDWQLDLIAWQPLNIFPDRPEIVDRSRWLYGGIGDWRRWSEIVTVQPYYLVLDKAAVEEQVPRKIHTIGLRGYGIVGETGWDYDGGMVFQFGNDGDLDHRAFAFTSEIGYTWSDLSWKPRLSGFCGYGSGDRDPNDDVSQRFDRLFGFRRPWSANDYIGWDNVLAPKVRLDFQPHQRVQVDLGYGAFWLASATDTWIDTGLHDPTGQSGTFKGHELDIRVRCQATQRLDVTLGYAYFTPGEFTRNLGRPEVNHFFYLETLTNAFQRKD